MLRKCKESHYERGKSLSWQSWNYEICETHEINFAVPDHFPLVLQWLCLKAINHPP